MALRTIILALLTILPSTLANPTPLVNTRQATVPCGAFLCKANQECKVISGRPVCVPKFGIPCGKNVCAPGETCCNESCGVCTKPGVACLPYVCPLDSSTLGSEKRQSSGAEMMERSSDMEKREASFGIPCGKNVCARGETCCNASCGVCTKPGEKCLPYICPLDARAPSAEKRQSLSTEQMETSLEMEKREGSGTDETQRIGQQCGPKVCGPNQRCCNPSCGYCVYPFEVCVPRVCGKEE